MSRSDAVSGIAVACAAVVTALATAAPAQAAGALTIDNRLRECVAIQPGLRGIEHGIAVQHITLDIKKPIGECGCKSAIMSYASHAVLDGGARGLLLQARLGAREAGPRTLPVASDATLVGDRPVVLSFDCAAPD